ncbi:hypothetical protein ACLQ3C_12275 [Gordonia sp. DT30]|uniref:hypothetical protein n=1 Tax=unclassified Gordonia (in: high G+C Gram-positive bacteria) TaxID=2657482 RepID=UPI003CFA9A94
MSDTTHLTPTPSKTTPVNGRAQAGRALLVIVGVATIVIPVLLDGVIMRGAHMDNPAWLPHAKLHLAIGFFAGMALGIGALICLLVRPVTDRFTMLVGAYLAGAFWISVLAAGCWPGTSYYFVDDPVFSHPLHKPQTLGMPNNVATAVLMLVLVAAGSVLVLRPQKTSGNSSGN